jgi:predicted transcriptional regulator
MARPSIIRIHPICAEAAEIRKSQRLSQDWVSRRAGFCSNMCNRMERGRHNPSIQAVSDYLEALGKKLKIVDLDEGAAS